RGFYRAMLASWFRFQTCGMNATPANTSPESNPRPAPGLDTLLARRGKADRKSPELPLRKFRVAATCRFVPTPLTSLMCVSIYILLMRRQIFPHLKIYSVRRWRDPRVQVDTFSP